MCVGNGATQEVKGVKHKGTMFMSGKESGKSGPGHITRKGSRSLSMQVAYRPSYHHLYILGLTDVMHNRAPQH